MSYVDGAIADAERRTHLAYCVVCSAAVDTREVSEGGSEDGCETSAGWVCSWKCDEIVQERDTTERLRERLAQLGDRAGVEDLDPEGRWVTYGTQHGWRRRGRCPRCDTHRVKRGRLARIRQSDGVPEWLNVPGGIRGAIRAANAEVERG